MGSVLKGWGWVCAGGGRGARVVSGAASQVPRTPSTDHLRRREREERERGRVEETGKKGETFLKQKTKT